VPCATRCLSRSSPAEIDAGGGSGYKDRLAMKIKRRNSNVKRRRLGFRARMRTRNGRKIVNRRRKLRGTFP